MSILNSISTFLRAKLSGLSMPLLFLKATVKKQIWVPQYVTHKGVVVPGHHTFVHVTDDHDEHKIIAGQGSHSQKSAHAKLSKEAWFTALPHDHQVPILLEHATAHQDKASSAAVLSTFKKKILAGQAPTNAEWKAYDQADADKKDEICKKADKAGVLVSMVNSFSKWKAANPGAPAVSVAAPDIAAPAPDIAPVVSAPAPGVKPVTPQVATAAWDIKAPAAPAGLDPATSSSWSYLQSMVGKMKPMAAAYKWLEANPGKKNDLSSSLVDLGHLETAKNMGIYVPPSFGKPPVHPPIGPGPAPAGGAAKDALLAKIQAAKLPETNTNHKPVNQKLQAIHDAVKAGDAKALLGHGHGSNTYAHKAVKLANEALAVLGSKHQVAAGQKAGTHAGLADVAPVAAAVAPTAPNFPAPPGSMRSDQADYLLAIAKKNDVDKLKKIVSVYADNGAHAASAYAEQLLEALGIKPKEGDTKTGMFGMLILKNGHWVNQGAQNSPTTKMAPASAPSAAEAAALSPSEIPPLPDIKNQSSCQIAASHAKAGDIANLEKLINSLKISGKNYIKTIGYASDLLAKMKTKLTKTSFSMDVPADDGDTGLAEADAIFANSVANAKVPPDIKKLLDGKAAEGAKEYLQTIAKVHATQNPHVAAYAQKLLDEISSGAQPAKAAKPAKPAGLPDHLIPAMPNGADHKTCVSMTDMAKAGNLEKLKSTVKNLPNYKEKTKEFGQKLISELEARQGVAAAASGTPAAAGPQDGDTKPGADGTLVFKDGRWHKQADADGGWEFDPNNKSMAGAPALTLMVDGDLLVLVKWSNGNYQVIDGDNPDGESFAKLQDAVAYVIAEKGQDVPVSAVKKLDPSYAGQPAKMVKELNFENTTAGHSKWWSVSLHGSKMVTKYGKIGAKGTQTIKEFASAEDAGFALAALTTEKMAKGYVQTPSTITASIAPGAGPSKVVGAKVKEAAPAPAAPAAAPTIKPVALVKEGEITVMVADGWPQTGPQKGSNPGGKFKDGKGVEWYCKFPGDPDVVKNELLAAKFYEMLGVKVPSLRLVKKDGKLGIASKWVDGLKKGTAAELATAPGAHSGFVFDAWLANWDVVGMTNDNLMLDAKGAVRVDVGGSLLYRAQGGAKGAEFGDTVPELESLIDPTKNGKSAAVFAGLSADSTKQGAATLAKMREGQIKKMVDLFGPGDQAAKEALTNKLIARRLFILQKFGIADPWSVPEPDMSKLTVNAADLSAPIDFSNYKGGGKGLSSKEHINKQNTIDDAALIHFAQQGNLIALKNYQYDAYNKETGAPIGKKPITDHPSKDIKEHWAYLVELLDSIAHPSIIGLDMPSLGSGTVQEVADAAGFIGFGERVATIPAEKRLGFWMKIAHAGDDFLDLVPKKTQWVPASVVTASKAAWGALNGITKAFVAEVQASGWINHIFSEGKTHVSASGNGGNYDGGPGGLCAQVYKDAVELEEGTKLTRWMQMPEAMMAQLLKEKPGLIFQNTDSMCTSIGENWGKSSHFGSGAVLNIVYAKGAKAIHSFASGHFKSEQEITTLMGQRFVLLKATKGNASNANGVTLDLLMLPPHEGFVADIENHAKLGKSFVFFKQTEHKGGFQ